MEREFFDRLGEVVEPTFGDLVADLVTKWPLLTAGIVIGLVAAVVGILLVAS